MTQDAPGITQLGNDSCVEIYHRPQCWGYRPGERMRRKGRRVSRSQKEDHLLPIPPHLKQRCVTVRCVSHSGHGGVLEPHATGHHKGVRCQPVAENVSQYILKYASRHQNSLPVPRPRQWRGQKKQCYAKTPIILTQKSCKINKQKSCLSFWNQSTAQNSTKTKESRISEAALSNKTLGTQSRVHWHVTSLLKIKQT